MSKKFTFQITKQKLTVDKEAFSLLQSWQDAILAAFSDSSETISDLENSLYSKLETKLVTSGTLTKEVVATEIANLHNLNKDEILKIHDSVLNKFYLNPNRAELSGVCDMLARVTGLNVGIIRFFYVIFWFISSGIGFWFYLGTSLILPSEQNSLTNYFIKSILGENVNLEEKLDQRSAWLKKTDKVLDFVSPIIFRSLATLAIFASFIVSLIYSYVCTGLILQKIGFWPDVLWISTDIIDVENAPTLVIIIFFTTLLATTLLGSYILTKLLKEIRLPKVNQKSIYKKISLLGILLLIFIISQYLFEVKSPTLTQKNFAIGEAREITILQNEFFCPTKYKVIIQKSDLNTVSLVGDAARISGLTFDKYNEIKEVATVTNIYPLRTCFGQKSEVTIMINTNLVDIKIAPHTFWTSDSDYTLHQTIRPLALNKKIV
jgi:phage shock protein PspC (stress-responsive transcriptional regulator)